MELTHHFSVHEVRKIELEIVRDKVSLLLSSTTFPRTADRVAKFYMPNKIFLTEYLFSENIRRIPKFIDLYQI